MPPRPKLDDSHKEEVQNLLNRGLKNAAIADTYGVGVSTVDRFVRQHKLTRPRTKASVPTGKPSREEELEAELKELRSRAKRDRAGEVAAKRLERQVKEAIEAAPPKFEPAPLKAGGGKRHVHNLLLSDLHAGEVVEPAEVGGMNRYNWDVLELRMKQIHSSLLSYQHNRPYPIEELVISMLGDMVGGAHHEELAATNQFPSAEQSYRVGMLLGQFVEELVPHYPRVRVYAVGGNHGRVTKKPASKQIFNSFDWLSYKIAEQYCRNYDVEWEIGRGNALVADIAGNKILLFHGDGIRSTMPGVPWGGVIRRTNELRKLYARQGVHLDGFQLGHFHQANAVSGPIWMNGSVKGPDEHSVKQFGSADPAEQLLLTFNAEKRRRTDVSYINPDA